MIKELRAMREKVPEYVHLKPRQMQGLVRVASLSQELLDAGIGAITLNPSLEQATGWTHEELLDEMDAIRHWTAVQSELRATMKGVDASILKRRYAVGLAVLQIYGLLEQLARNPDNRDLLPVLENLKRLNKTGKRKTPPPQDDEPE
jgi:hypothetical protein